MKPVDEALKEACYVSDTQQIRVLLGDGARVNGFDKDHRTPLMHVCRAEEYRQETIAAVEILLKAGANVNARSDFWCTPLMYAAKKMRHVDFRLPVIQKLIAEGANVNAVDKYGYSVLARVMRDILVWTDWDHFVKLVDLLLYAGADLNFKAKKGLTPLLLACDRNPVIARFLLEKGADPCIKDDQGRTVLSIARKKMYNDIIKEIEVNHQDMLLDEWIDQGPGGFCAPL